MKFGIRVPSLKKRFAARISLKRFVRHNMGFKVPRGLGYVTNPKKAIYNTVYNRTSVSVDRLTNISLRKPKRLNSLDGKTMTLKLNSDNSVNCPNCKGNMGQLREVGWLNKRKEYKCPFAVSRLK